MNKKIYCSFFKKEEKQLEMQPYPDKLGQLIYNNISKKAWIMWNKQQTMIINEKKLNLSNKKDREFLEQEMISFLFKNT